MPAITSTPVATWRASARRPSTPRRAYARGLLSRRTAAFTSSHVSAPTGSRHSPLTNQSGCENSPPAPPVQGKPRSCAFSRFDPPADTVITRGAPNA